MCVCVCVCVCVWSVFHPLLSEGLGGGGIGDMLTDYIKKPLSQSSLIAYSRARQAKI